MCGCCAVPSSLSFRHIPRDVSRRMMVIADPKDRQACVVGRCPRMHGSRRRPDDLDGARMIVRGVIACSSGDITVQGTQRAIAEVAAIIDSQPCGQPLCYRTDVLDHRIEVYNGRAGAGMSKVQGTSGACIEFGHARFRLSSCEGKAKDDFRACQGFEGLEVPHERIAWTAIIKSGLSPTHRIFWSCEE
jgi:hypothetical protein